MKDLTPILIGVGISGGILAGLVWWGHENQRIRQQMAKDDPTIDPVGMFPGLRVGDAVILDSARAHLPAPFSALPQVPGVVDRVLMDPLLVSVRVGGPAGGTLPTFSGTVERAAILRLLTVPTVPGLSTT